MVIREVLLRNDQLNISGLGTLKVESLSSEREQITNQRFLLHPPRKRVVLEGDPSDSTDPALIAELASNLRTSEEEAAAILDLLIKEILVQAPVHIPEIGVLKQSEGKLEFLSDPELEAFLLGAHANLNSLEVKRESIATPKTRRRKLAWAISIPIAVGAAVIGYFAVQNNFRPSQQASSNTESPALLPIAPDSMTADSAVSITSIDNFDPVNQPITDGFRVRPEPNPEQPSITLENAADPPPIETPPAPTQADPETPLLNRESGGYTLIIGSFDTSAQASILITQYRDIYPTVPISTLQNRNNTLYRVAIGQVPTIAEALALKERLTELPADAWVLNILNNDL